jgi:hypothetical protein
VVEEVEAEVVKAREEVVDDELVRPGIEMERGLVVDEEVVADVLVVDEIVIGPGVEVGPEDGKSES